MSDDYRDPVDDYNDIDVFAEEHYQEFEPILSESTPESRKQAYEDAEFYYATHHKDGGNGGSSGGCYVATCVYGSYDCPEVWTLRRFRDHTLARTWYGRAFVRTYYVVSPALVRVCGKYSWFRNLWKPVLDRMVSRLREEGVEDTPYDDQDWS